MAVSASASLYTCSHSGRRPPRRVSVHFRHESLCPQPIAAAKCPRPPELNGNCRPCDQFGLGRRPNAPPRPRAKSQLWRSPEQGPTGPGLAKLFHNKFRGANRGRLGYLFFLGGRPACLHRARDQGDESCARNPRRSDGLEVREPRLGAGGPDVLRRFCPFGSGTVRHPKMQQDLHLLSNCLWCQWLIALGFQCLPFLTMLLRMVRSLRIQAVNASFLGFPAASSRW